MRYILKNSEELSREARAAYDALGIAPLTASLLHARGVPPEAAADFLSPRLEQLHDPFLFRNMRAVCDRLRLAAERREQTVIYGDYDCDGVCGSVILQKTLSRIGIPCRVYLPDRATEGYGTNHAAFARLMEEGAQLFFMVDCGIRSVEDVAFARAEGRDCIIFDHHECGELPDTPYLVNGKLPGETYPFPALCGAGLAFKLAQALLGQEAYALLEFAGVATIADMVPLLGENRILASAGLQNLNTAPSVGIRSLMEAAGMRKPVDAHGVGFGIAPRINAAGRLAHGKLAVELLLSEDKACAAELAAQLNELNERRQALQKRIIAQAEQQVRENTDLSRERVLFVAGMGWDKGVVGLAAASLAATFCRPAVVLSEESGVLTGSARSIPGVNLYELLCACEAQYTRFGGHAMAAGLTFPAAALSDIAAQVNARAREVYPDEVFLPTVYYDAPLALAEVNLNLAEQIEALAPFGQENEEPVFFVPKYRPSQVRRLGDGSHVKMTEAQAEVLWFRAQREVQAGASYALTASLGVNTFRGRSTPQLIVRSMEPCALSEEEERAIAQDFLREFPSEVEALATFLRSGAPCAAEEAVGRALRQAVSKSPLGTVLFVGSEPGRRALGRLVAQGLSLPECRSLSPDSAENCICYARPPARLQNHTHCFLIGNFSSPAPEGAKAMRLWDEAMAADYRAELAEYALLPGELPAYARAIYATGKHGFSRMGELLAGASERLGGASIKKIWFAWKVCSREKLLQLRRNGKIYVIFQEQTPDWRENPLLAAAAFLREDRA